MTLRATALVLLFQLSPAGLAQDAEDWIAACARISSTGDRILCLENALRGTPPSEAAVGESGTEEVADILAETPAVEQTEAETGAVIVNEPIADATTANEPIADEPIADEPIADEPIANETSGTASATIEVPAETPADASTTVEDVSPPTAPAVELGAEQVAKREDIDKEQVRVSASIVQHQLVGTGRLRLTLDNGQVWQQTGDDDDRIARRLRGREQIPVEMWQSRSGGYRMYLVDLDRTLRVRRIR